MKTINRGASNVSHRNQKPASTRLWRAAIAGAVGSAALVIASPSRPHGPVTAFVPAIPQANTAAGRLAGPPPSVPAASAMVTSRPIPAGADPRTGRAAVLPGWRAAIDPVTGQLREPEPDELRALEQVGETDRPALGRPSTERRSITGRHGGRGVVLEPEDLAALVATVGPDGKVSFSHATGRSAQTGRPREGGSPQQPKEVTK